MKKIKVTLQKEVEVDVLIDEIIVDEQTLKAIYDHFEEALQNFANKTCEKQRKECANFAKCKYDNDVFGNGSTSINSIMDAILDAEQPKIEEL